MIKIFKEKRKRVVFSMTLYMTIFLISLLYSSLFLIADVLLDNTQSVKLLVGASFSFLFFVIFFCLAMNSFYYEKDVNTEEKLGKMYQASLQGRIYETKEGVNINGKRLFLPEIQTRADSAIIVQELSKALSETEKSRKSFEKIYNFLKSFSFSF